MKKNKKIIFIMTVFLCITLIPLFSYCTQLEVNEPEYTDEYKNWLELSEEERKNYIEPRMYKLPEKTEKKSILSKLFASFQDTNCKSEKSVPSELTRYITNYGNTKDQGLTSACWAVSSATCFSSNYNLLNTNSKVFSGFYIDFITSNDYNPNGKGFNRKFNSGGNMYIAMPAAMNGYGIVLSSDMEKYNLENSTYIYDNVITATENTSTIKNQLKSIESNYYVSNYIEISGKNEIKKYIYNYGAASTFTYIKNSDFFSTSDVYNTEDIAYCCTDANELPNHAITLVGWDDNYTNTAFNGKKGAYIVLNSWGEEFGQNGLYYIFYDDVFMNLPIIGATEVKEKDYDHLFEYDDCGFIGALDFGSVSNVYAANVFKNDCEEEQMLTMISAYFPESKLYDIYIYDGEIPSNISNTTQRIQYNVTTPGYYQIKLDDPIILKNSKFTVMVKYTRNVPVEYTPSTDFNEFYYVASSNIGESFCSVDGISFIDMYNGIENFSKVSNCIKAYTKDYIPIQYTVTFDSNGGSNVDSQTGIENQKATKPATPIKEGFVFEGWFLGENEYNFDTPITENITLRAKWMEKILDVTEETKTNDIIKIQDKKIYLRLNGDSNGIVTVSEFIQKMDFNVEWTKIIIEKYGNNSIIYNKNTELNDKNANMENATKIKICTESNEYEYDYFQMGNIYLESSSNNSALNINDVVQLRKLILQGTDLEKIDSNVKIENSDVNFSNDELGEVGDIGDVISIRYKILCNAWIFSSEDLKK